MSPLMFPANNNQLVGGKLLKAAMIELICKADQLQLQNDRAGTIEVIEALYLMLDIDALYKEKG